MLDWVGVGWSILNGRSVVRLNIPLSATSLFSMAEGIILALCLIHGCSLGLGFKSYQGRDRLIELFIIREGKIDICFTLRHENMMEKS